MTGYALSKAIYRYRAAWNQYLADSIENDDVPRGYVPALEVLQQWREPAGDCGSAQEALTLAIEFYKAGDSPVIPAMMRAALGYLENREKIQ